MAAPLPYSHCVADGQRFVEVGRADDRQHRAEDFFLPDAHRRARRDRRRSGRCRKPSRFELAAAVEGDRRAVLLGDVEVAGDAVAVLGADHRAHVDVFVAVGRADAQLAGVVDQAFDDRVARLADRHGHAAGHAPLAGAAVGRRGERLHGLIHVGVGHDDEMVLRPAGRLHALAVPPCRARRCTWRSAVEPTNEMAATLRMIEQRVDALAVAVHDVEHAVRQAGLDQQLAQPHRRERHFFRRLEHERVAAGDARSGTSTAAP